MKVRNWWDEDKYIVDTNRLINLFSENNIWYRVNTPFEIWGNNEKTLVPKGSVLQIEESGNKTVFTAFYNNLEEHDLSGNIMKTHPEIFTKIEN